MTPVQKLYDLLHLLQIQLDELAGILLLERDTIIHLNTTETEKNGLKISELFQNIAPLNQQISAAIHAACESASVVGDNNISSLVTFLPKPEREMLSRIQAAVRAKAETVNNTLSVNRSLLQDSLHFTKQSLQMFTNALHQTSSTTYGERGRFVSVPDQPHIICKEI